MNIDVDDISLVALEFSVNNWSKVNDFVSRDFSSLLSYRHPLTDVRQISADEIEDVWMAASMSAVAKYLSVDAPYSVAARVKALEYISSKQTARGFPCFVDNDQLRQQAAECIPVLEKKLQQRETSKDLAEHLERAIKAGGFVWADAENCHQAFSNYVLNMCKSAIHVLSHSTIADLSSVQSLLVEPSSNEPSLTSISLLNKSSVSQSRLLTHPVEQQSGQENEQQHPRPRG